MKRSNICRVLILICVMLISAACGSSGSSSDNNNPPDGDTDEMDGDYSGGEADNNEDGDLNDGDLDTITDGDASENESETDAEEDAERTEETDCVALYGEGWAYNPSATEGDGCKDCTTKVCPPESSTGIYHVTTLNGRCVCETIDGYFFSDTTYLPTPCDWDDDGWTTITAREFVESNDPALQENARCDVRTVDRFILHPEEAGYDAVEVDIEPMSLYEQNNRDDQNQLDLDTSRAPAYGDGRRLMAEELNSFTKFCVDTLADYNGNGVSDVAEWSGHEGLDQQFAVYAPFAYFGELDHGWYDPNDGAYHIAENSRDSNGSPLSVPIVTDGGSEYWRECRRMADASYDPDEPTAGMDFADYEGMFHHSQFKCLQVVNPSELNDREPEKVSVAQVAEGWRMDECRVPDGNEPDGDEEDGDIEEYEADTADIEASETETDIDNDGDADETVDFPRPNPSYPLIECEERGTVNVGDVGLAVSNYVDYTVEGEYSHGCVNECVEGWDGLIECNGYEAGTADCDTDVDEFGAGTCGCMGNYSYPECTSCIDHFSPESECTACYDTADQGHWAGARCDVCRGNWNISAACKSCINHYTPASDCTACYDTDAQGHWAGANCNVCKNHYTIGSNCKLCATNYTLASACTECSGNFDVDQNCLACLDNDTDGHWTGTSCNECRDNYYPGEFDSGNLVLTPNGSQTMTNWEGLSPINYGEDANGGYIHVSTIIVNPSVTSRQNLALGYALPVLSDSQYQNVEFAVQASMKNNGINQNVVFEYYDRAYKKLGQTTLTCNSTSWQVSGPQTVTVTETLRRTRFIFVRLNVAGFPGEAYFRGISFTVRSAMVTSQECRFCEYGFVDDPGIAGDDCLKCPSGAIDTEHWNTSGCYKCADDNTNGHWEMPDCSSCKFLWSGIGCNVCQEGTFVKDTTDQCTLTKGLVTNEGAELADMSEWDSNIPLTRHTSLNNIDAAAKGQYFFSMHDADGEKNPYAEQRITLSQTIRDAISAGAIGYLNISVYLAAHTDSDSPSVKVYQVTTVGGSGTQCGGTLTTDNEDWTQRTNYCSVNTSVKELRVRLDGENDNGGACNAYWDDIQVYFSAKLPELL